MEYVFLLIICLIFLVVLHIVLAMRHDHAVSIAGPLAEREAVEAQVERLKAELSDVEEDLRKRREAIINMAEIQADIDAALRRRDELNIEWSQLEERREEIRSLRQDADEAFVRKAQVEGELEEYSNKLEEVKVRLEQADNIETRISELSDERDNLSGELERLRPEAEKLRSAGEELQKLSDEIAELEREISRLSGLRDAEQEKLKDMTARLDAERASMAESEKKRSDVIAELKTAGSARRLIDEETRSLEARKASLETELKNKTGGVAGGDGDSDDAFEKLPLVLEQLRGWSEWNPEDEAAALKRVKDRMEEIGLKYHNRTIHAFHTAMKVNETTQITILAGISGTGKSQLPRRYAEAMGIGFLQVPVQPRWDSPQDLMGFYNYIESRYRPTQMAQALYHMDQYNRSEVSEDVQNRMLMILLDEMNLARVEYYFSDFLSRLESRPSSDEAADPKLRKDSEIELEIPTPKNQTVPRIFPGYNLFFAGTMNEDESTQSLSDKVVDRANVMRFAAPQKIETSGSVIDDSDTQALSQALSWERWSKWVRGPDQLGSDEAQVNGYIEQMVDLMRNLQRPFGHRLGRSIMAYASNYPKLEGEHRSIEMAIADQVEMRLLPKLRGVDTTVFENRFSDLSNFVSDELGDEELSRAIKYSYELSEAENHQFLWRGVTRS